MIIWIGIIMIIRIGIIMIIRIGINAAMPIHSTAVKHLRGIFC